MYFFIDGDQASVVYGIFLLSKTLSSAYQLAWRL